MILLNDIYWAIPYKEAYDNLEPCQRRMFKKFMDRQSLPATDDGELAIYKETLDKFYQQFGYYFFDRLNEEGNWF